MRKRLKIAQIPANYYDNNMLFCVKNGEYVGLSLNNKQSNRTANVLIIGGSGTGKTYKYVKPNILQENCSQVITDPSGDIFRSFAPYLLSKGYNVYLFNVNDFTLSNNYNPLENAYDVYGNIVETQVDVLVSLYIKNAKASDKAGKSSGDPFWDSAEKAFITALIYYCLEEDEKLIKEGFEVTYTRPAKRGETDKWTPEEKKARIDPQTGEIIEKQQCKGYEGGRCFSTILHLAHEAEVSDDANKKSPLTVRLEDFFKRHPKNKTTDYYKTFSGCKSEKTASTIVLCTTIDLQLFATTDLDRVTRTNPIKEMNINFDRIGSQQSYLFLGIPQDDQTYNFLVAMLQAQLFKRLYQLGDKKMRGKWHIGYRVGTPIFDYFNSFEEAKTFFETVNDDYETVMIPKLDKDGKVIMHKVTKTREEVEKDKNGETIMIKVKEKGQRAKKVAKTVKVAYEVEEPVLVPKMIDVPVLDTDGNPVLDADGNPVTEKKEEKRYVGNIIESQYINDQTMYKIHFNHRDLKVSPVRQVLVDLINNIDKMYIWSGDKFAGSDPALPIHVNFLLDEFKNIGEIPNFLNYLATVRKYRIGLHIIIQDIGQIKTMYKEQEHETLLANVDTTIFLGSILTEDKEFMQKMLGKTTIRQRSTSDSKSGQSVSYTPTEVPLMSLDEIGAINDPNANRDDCIVVVRDCDPIVGRKLLLYEHCRAKEVDKAKDIINIELFWRNNNESKQEIKEVKVG